MCGHFLARQFLVRILRQQQARLEKRKPCRHHQIICRQFDTQNLGVLDEIQILLREMQHRNLAQIDLLSA